MVPGSGDPAVFGGRYSAAHSHYVPVLSSASWSFISIDFIDCLDRLNDTYFLNLCLLPCSSYINVS